MASTVGVHIIPTRGKDHQDLEGLFRQSISFHFHIVSFMDMIPLEIRFRQTILYVMGGAEAMGR